MTQPPPFSIFKSFLMGGFEASTHRNSRDIRVDMIIGSDHERQVAGDYMRVREQGLLTIRDATRWHLIERERGIYDFSSLEPMVDAAVAAGVQVIWDLMHYGIPDWLDVFSEEFPDCFAQYSHAVAVFIEQKLAAAGNRDARVYAPVNEISFMSWAGSDARLMYPWAAGRGRELKRQLVRAAIKSMDAVWQVNPAARFLHVDPLINVMHPLDQTHHHEDAASYHLSQYEAWDMIAGRLDPELGGDMKYLDIVGINFYHDNQWEHPTGFHLEWARRPRDERWKRFSELAPAVFERYGRPFMLSETGHIGIGRAEWLEEITLDILMLHAEGLPITGVCLYPIIDRTCWENVNHWHNSGLWDAVYEHGILKRVLVPEFARQVRMTRRLFDRYITAA